MSLVHRHRSRVAALFAAVIAGSVGLAACGQLLGIPGESEIGLTESGVGPQGGEGGPLAEGSTGTDGNVTSETPAACEGIDFKTDKKNCGACGHDCLGGECQASTCQPFLLAANQGRPITIAVDDKYVFWGDQSASLVRRVGKDGAGLAVVVSAVDVQGVASDGEFLYWGVHEIDATGGVWRKLRTASESEPAEQIAQSGYVWDVNVFKGRVYFTAPNDGTVRSMAPDGGTPKVHANGINQVRHVAVDDLNAYYTSYQSQTVQIPLDGGDAEVDIGPQDYGDDIATDGVHVAWGNSHYTDDRPAELHLWSASLNNGLARKIVTGPPSSKFARDGVAVAMDQDRIYFTFIGASDGAADGFLGWCPKTGCDPSGPVILVKADRPSAVTLDETAIYYSTYDQPGFARVWKLAKP